jgi:hypothetical protein
MQLTVMPNGPRSRHWHWPSRSMRLWWPSRRIALGGAGQGHDRRDVDHAAPTPLFHAGHQRAGQRHHVGQVQVHQVLPVLVADFVDRGWTMFQPALFTRMSTRPSFATASSGNAGRPAGAMSAARDSTRSRFRCASHRPRPAATLRLRLHRNRSAPARANPRAMAYPIPLLPPVIQATGPSDQTRRLRRPRGSLAVQHNPLETGIGLLPLVVESGSAKEISSVCHWPGGWAALVRGGKPSSIRW